MKVSSRSIKEGRRHLKKSPKRHQIKLSTIRSGVVLWWIQVAHRMLRSRSIKFMLLVPLPLMHFLAFIPLVQKKKSDGGRPRTYELVSLWI